MGNWLENLMHKLEEQEIQKQADAKIAESQLAEEKVRKDAELVKLQEESSGQREEIRQQLRSILVKYEVPSILKDLKDTIWKNGRIVEESDISPNGEWTSKVAMGLVYAYKQRHKVDYETTNSQDSGTVYRKINPWLETRVGIDGIIIRIEHAPSLQDKPKIYFKSGILVDTSDHAIEDYHRNRMKEQFMWDPQGAPQSQLIVGQNDPEIISSLRLALATDSLKRQKYNGLPKRGLFSDKKLISI